MYGLLQGHKIAVPLKFLSSSFKFFICSFKVLFSSDKSAKKREGFVTEALYSI